MKKLLIAGLVLMAGMFSLPAKADVHLHWGAGKPAVVTGTHRAHKHQHKYEHHRYAPHRYYGPPVVYYPERSYRHAHPHYRGKPHYQHHKYVRPPLHHHARPGHRPGPPPHVRPHGHGHR